MATLLEKSSSLLPAVVCPAAAFTSATPSSVSAGAATRLTSAGAHGFTNAINVNKYVYIGAGNGWTAGLYRVSAIDADTTGVAITLDVPFSAGFGVPALVLVNGEVIIKTITLPPLQANSLIEIDTTFSSNTTTNKYGRIKLETAYFCNVTMGANTVMRNNTLIHNRASPDSQVGGNYFNVASPLDIGPNNTTTSAINTANPVNLIFAAALTVTGTYVTLERYAVYLDL